MNLQEIEISRGGIYTIALQAHKGCLESLQIGAQGNGFVAVRELIDQFDKLLFDQGAWTDADIVLLKNISLSLGMGENPDIDELTQRITDIAIKLAAIIVLAESGKKKKWICRGIIEEAAAFTKALGDFSNV